MKQLAVYSCLFLSLILPSISTAQTDFSKVQNFDNTFTKKLAWQDTKTADTISDWSLYAITAWPIVEAINNDETTKRLGALGTAHYLSWITTQYVKNSAARPRPDGSDTKSFFSGHTSAAFTGAAYICGTENSQKCGLALGIASSTGYLRIAGKRHWATDVLTGAAIGSLFGYSTPVFAFGF